MKMGAASGRSRQTSAPGYRLLEETRHIGQRADGNCPLSGRKRRRRKERNSVCRPIGQFLPQVTNLARRIKPRRKGSAKDER
jgi:hypothetical protein